MFNVTVVLNPGVTKELPNETVVFAGIWLADKAMFVLKPPNPEVLSVATPLFERQTDTSGGLLKINVEEGEA